MATHDYVIANGTGAAVRSDLNGALAAIVSNNSGATEPATMYAYQWWPDTTTGLLKQRNSANSAWITIGTLASANLGLLSLAGGTMTGVLAVTAGTAALPGIAVSGDLNTGIYSPGADQIGISTGGSVRATIDSSGRLLVGTSSTSSVNALVQVRLDGDNKHLELLRSSNDGGSAAIWLTKSRGSAASPSEVSNGDQLGFIVFRGHDGTDYRDAAYIYVEADGTWTDGGDTTDNPSRLVFSVTADGASSPTERMRIGNAGRVTVTCADSSGVDAITVYANGTSGNQYGITVATANDQNGTSTFFFRGNGSATERFTARTNGGLANYQANNVNLSDRNAKKDISLAADTWNRVKEWEIVNYRYNDQPDDADLNLGVVAQQVAESCPEVITVFQEAKEATEDALAQEKRLGVKEQQMYWMAIKALQEAMERIETLEASNADMLARLTALEAA